MNRIEIGIVAKPQGIKGEIKISPLTDDNSRFLGLKNVWVGETEYRVLSSRIGGGEVFLALSGIADRNAAEMLRGKSIYVDRADAVKPKKGHYFIADVIGCEVIGIGGKRYGAVTDVLQHGAADVFELDNGVLFPFLKTVATDVNTDEKKIIVDDERFAEVAVYED